MLRPQWLVLFLALSKCCAKKAEAFEALLELTDETLPAALEAHPLMLLTIGIPECEPCNLVALKVVLQLTAC